MSCLTIPIKTFSCNLLTERYVLHTQGRPTHFYLLVCIFHSLRSLILHVHIILLYTRVKEHINWLNAIQMARTQLIKWVLSCCFFEVQYFPITINIEFRYILRSLLCSYIVYWYSKLLHVCYANQNRCGYQASLAS